LIFPVCAKATKESWENGAKEALTLRRRAYCLTTIREHSHNLSLRLQILVRHHKLLLPSLTKQTKTLHLFSLLLAAKGSKAASHLHLSAKRIGIRTGSKVFDLLHGATPYSLLSKPVTVATKGTGCGCSATNVLKLLRLLLLQHSLL
jgi:hypothetical protein